MTKAEIDFAWAMVMLIVLGLSMTIGGVVGLTHVILSKLGGV